MAASTLRSPPVLASAAAVGGILLWRYLSSRSSASCRASTAASTEKAVDERVHRGYGQALATGSKPLASQTVKDDDEPFPVAFEQALDDDEPFCLEIEEQQCVLVGELLQSLRAAVPLGDASPVGKTLSKAIEELQVYRQGLTDTEQLASRSSQLRQTAEAMQMLLLAGDERDLMAILRREQEVSELTDVLEALEKVNSTDVNEGGVTQATRGAGNTCCGGGMCGNLSAVETSPRSAATCCGGGKRDSCGESSRENTETGGVFDLSASVAQCTTSEELSALCNRLVEREISSVLAANPHLQIIPEQRKRVIRAQIEATLATVAEENTMLATGPSSCGTNRGCPSCPSKGSCSDQDATGSSSKPSMHIGSDGTVKLSSD